mmetsp:Transcript_23229/g.66659  ORF Transcript_23229/g.66659 Transcript_23229/m.66659 type:complete len:81 (+) Transcript_23229:458-700(+)
MRHRVYMDGGVSLDDIDHAEGDYHGDLVGDFELGLDDGDDHVVVVVVVVDHHLDDHASAAKAGEICEGESPANGDSPGLL